MKTTNTLYWLFTILFALMMTGSAIPDILMDPMAIQGMHTELGYPLYFIPFIGVAKVLGVLIVLIPAGDRLKEWAYAGLIFDLLGATYSIIAIGKPDFLFMALPLALGAFSYFFYHKKRRLQKIRKGENALSAYPIS